jgi:hypothetical protein
MGDPRTLRQRLVPEIGDEGQAHIDAATAIVTSAGLTGEVEAHYLAGAGFGCIRTATHSSSRAAHETNPKVVISADADPIPLPDHPLADSIAELKPDPAVLAVAQGAARALRQIRVAARIDVVPVFLKEADAPPPSRKPPLPS